MHSDAFFRSAALLAWIALAAPAFAHEDHPAPQQDQKHAMMSWGTEFFVLSELLELSPGLPGRPVQYDLLGWVGNATDRLFVKAEGTQSTSSADGDTELQLLYGRLISPFWDLQVGLRGELTYGEGAPGTRFHAALGLQGMAPGFFELEPTLFVSFRGELSARLVASYDLLVTQRLVAQPRLETGAALQSVPEFGVGSGVTDLELGLRLRYEFLREFAPYVGFTWRQLLMETAELARASGRPAGGISFVAGLRLWY